MDLGKQVLSEVNIFGKYAKYLPKVERRESWQEICSRYEDMMLEKYPQLSSDIVKRMQLVRDKRVLPSMRALQFAGAAIERTPSRLYNCAYLPIDAIEAFSESIFLLLGGSGVGYSVQFHHVDKLPEIIKPTKTRRYLISDNIEGWADAIKMLMKAYMGITNSLPLFDFRDIRPKGAPLHTAGGKAPGPEPLKECLFELQKILDRKTNGEKLTPLECHDMMCYIANAVLAGGIRRAAMIALFSFDDKEMYSCKSGNWWELNPQRGRANNSAVILRSRITKEDFNMLWEQIRASGSGEPGMYLTNNIEWGTNPCGEIGLRPFQFCNLCEINITECTTQELFDETVETAAFFGTLQAGFTDFHYLRDIWKKTTEKDALLGLGMTGIASNHFYTLDLQKGVSIAAKTNDAVSTIIGVKPASRITCVKPSGTTSCVVGTSSGIHAWHSDYFIRRVELNSTDPLTQYFINNNPEILKPLKRLPGSYALEIPIKAPQDAITRHNESAESLLSRVQYVTKNWIKPGHRSGDNTHNVSVTISVKEEEWDFVREWLWDNRDSFNGASILPFDGGTYTEAPFEDISKEDYEFRYSLLKPLDLSKILEENDNTQFTQEIACAGGKC